MRALAIVRDLGERSWEAATLDSLGLIHDGLGEHARAVARYEQAAAIYAELGDRFDEADTLVSLGDIEVRRGDTTSGRKRWSDALLIFDEIGHPDGDEVRTKLQGSGPEASSRPEGPRPQNKGEAP